VELDMTALDYAAIGVLVFTACVLVALLAVLATWPARVARARRHPYLTAVSVGSWATRVFGGVFWPLVLIWAYTGCPDAELEEAAEK